MKVLLQKRSWRIIAAVVTLICCITAIGGLNKPHLNPFTNKLNTSYPTALAYSDAGIAIIDNEYTRMLIISNDYELETVVDTTMSGSPVGEIYELTMFEDRIFAIGANSYNKGAYISSESVLEYDMHGKYVQTLYTQTYTEEDKVTIPHFDGIIVDTDGIYLTQMEDCDISVFHIGDTVEEIYRKTLPETVYTAGYSVSTNECFAIGNSSNCYLIDCETDELKQIEFSEYLATICRLVGIEVDDVFENVNDGYYAFASIVLNADGAAQYCSLIDASNGETLVLSNDTQAQQDIAFVQYSIWFMLKNIGFWLAIAILGLEVLILIIWLLLKKLRKKGRIAILILGAIVLTSVFYTVQLNATSEKSYSKALVSQTKQISYMMSEICGDMFVDIRQAGIVEYCSDLSNQPSISKLRKMMKTVCDANDSEQSCYASLYLYDADWNLYAFADTFNGYLAGESIILSENTEQLLTESMHEPITIEETGSTISYDYGYVYSSTGEIVGVLCIAGLRGNMLYVQSQKILDMTVTLTALFIGAYMLITLIGSFSTDFKHRKSLNRTDVVGKSLDMARMLSFVRAVAYGLDSVIIVYVAKSLCTGLSTAAQAAMVSLPISLTSLGELLGMLAAPAIGKKIGERTCAIMNMVISIIGMLICAVAIGSGSIYIYILGKFITGLFLNGMMNVMCETVPFRARNDAERKSVRESIIYGSTAATILSALTGGYIAQYLSYKMIYMLGAALCVLLIFICFKSFLNTTRSSTAGVETAQKPAAGIKPWRFFLRGPVLVYLFLYMFPNCILSGYKSFLFPMYTASAGISALLLSNLSVFVRTFAFMTKKGVTELAKRLNSNMVLIGAKLVNCACLVCFLISPNIYWAIAMMFIYEIMTRMTDIPTWSYFVRLADDAHTDAKQVEPYRMALDSTMAVFRSPILSAVVTLGMNYACAAVGAVCGAMYTAFAFLIKRGKRT